MCEVSSRNMKGQRLKYDGRLTIFWVREFTAKTLKIGTVSIYCMAFVGT